MLQPAGAVGLSEGRAPSCRNRCAPAAQSQDRWRLHAGHMRKKKHRVTTKISVLLSPELRAALGEIARLRAAELDADGVPSRAASVCDVVRFLIKQEAHARHIVIGGGA